VGQIEGQEAAKGNVLPFNDLAHRCGSVATIQVSAAWIAGTAVGIAVQ
jgi:hypothetical protein